MKKRYWIDAAKLIVVFGIIWAAFAIIPWPSIHAPKGADLVSIEREKKLGTILMEQSILSPDAKEKVIHSPKLDSAIFIVTSRLLEHLDHPLFTYHFYVVEKKDVNAFTLPGGNIIIYSGLLDFCQTPEDLAAVLAHEIGHAQKRHVVTKLVNELGLSIMLSVLSGGNSSIIREVMRTAMSTSFSRDMEAEADAFSFSLMEKSNLDPTTLSDFFRRMKKEKDNDSNLSEFLSTHPSNTDRIRAALEYKTAAGFTIKPISLDWSVVKEELKKVAPTKVEEPASEE